MQSFLETYLSWLVFVSLEKHVKECGALDNHLIFLIKAIAEQYFQVKLHYAGSAYTLVLQIGESIVGRLCLSGDF